MATESALVLRVQGMIAREHGDPRLAQMLFLLPVAVDLVLLTVGDSFELTRDYGIGLAITAVATLIAFAIGGGGLPARLAVIVPLLDLLAISWFRLAPDNVLGSVLIIPCLWLALSLGRRGVLLGSAAVAGSLGLSSLLRADSVDLDTAIELLLVSAIASLLLAVTAEVWTSQVASSAEAQRMLERAVADSAEQRRFNEAILDSVEVGLMALDAQGRVQSMNPRHQQFLAAAHPDGFRGLPDQTGVIFAADGITPLAPEDLPTTRALRGERLRDYVVWVGGHPASRRAFAVSVAPFHTADGGFDGAVLAYHDVTELLAAARLKDEFVATVSHELRTPLTSIIGYVDLMLDDVNGLPEDSRQFLETIRRNARRLHRLVDDLLSDTLKLGRAELNLAPTSLADVVRASAEEAAKTDQAADLTMILDLPRNGLIVNGDAERLAQVFDNLLSNAAKFSPSGGKVVAQAYRERHEVVVRISDTGRGIPADELDHVFVKFFRSPSVQVDAIPGTGLGLAISKTIVEAHGGRIDVTSMVGVGTTVELRLPAADQRVGTDR